MGRVSHRRKNPVSSANGEHRALSIMQRPRPKIWIPKDSAGLCRVFDGGKQHVYNNILLILMACATACASSGRQIISEIHFYPGGDETMFIDDRFYLVRRFLNGLGNKIRLESVYSLITIRFLFFRKR